jgi:hypothetical protein
VYDIISALVPPFVMAAVVITFVVWLIRSQLAKKNDADRDEPPSQNEDDDDGN